MPKMKSYKTFARCLEKDNATQVQDSLETYH